MKYARIDAKLDLPETEKIPFTMLENRISSSSFRPYRGKYVNLKLIAENGRHAWVVLKVTDDADYVYMRNGTFDMIGVSRFDITEVHMARRYEETGMLVKTRKIGFEDNIRIASVPLIFTDLLGADSLIFVRNGDDDYRLIREFGEKRRNKQVYLPDGVSKTEPSVDFVAVKRKKSDSVWFKIFPKTVKKNTLTVQRIHLESINIYSGDFVYVMSENKITIGKVTEKNVKDQYVITHDFEPEAHIFLKRIVERKEITSHFEFFTSTTTHDGREETTYTVFIPKVVAEYLGVKHGEYVPFRMDDIDKFHSSALRKNSVRDDSKAYRIQFLSAMKIPPVEDSKKVSLTLYPPQTF